MMKHYTTTPELKALYTEAIALCANPDEAFDKLTGFLYEHTGQPDCEETLRRIVAGVRLFQDALNKRYTVADLVCSKDLSSSERRIAKARMVMEMLAAVEHLSDKPASARTDHSMVQSTALAVLDEETLDSHLDNLHKILARHAIADMPDNLPQGSAEVCTDALTPVAFAAALAVAQHNGAPIADGGAKLPPEVLGAEAAFQQNALMTQTICTIGPEGRDKVKKVLNALGVALIVALIGIGCWQLGEFFLYEVLKLSAKKGFTKFMMFLWMSATTTTMWEEFKTREAKFDQNVDRAANALCDAAQKIPKALCPDMIDADQVCSAVRADAERGAARLRRCSAATFAATAPEAQRQAQPMHA